MFTDFCILKIWNILQPMKQSPEYIMKNTVLQDWFIQENLICNCLVWSDIESWNSVEQFSFTGRHEKARNISFLNSKLTFEVIEQFKLEYIFFKQVRFQGSKTLSFFITI